MLAIQGASGNIGGHTLRSLLSLNLLAPTEIVALTSSDSDSPTWAALAAHGVHVRQALYTDGATFERALAGVEKLLLISSPRDTLDYDTPTGPDGTGREQDHVRAIDAARRAGVAHIYYASLAFNAPFAAPGASKAMVMRAHLRTEAYLATLSDVGVTVLRQGLYTEAWPLYLGHFRPADDARGDVLLAGDGPVCFTSLRDVGAANALILAAPMAEWRGRRVFLSAARPQARSMAQIARVVSEEVGHDVRIVLGDVAAYQEHYLSTRPDLKPGLVRFWSSTSPAIAAGEGVVDDDTLSSLLASRGIEVQSIDERVREMVREAKAGAPAQPYNKYN